jgi:hypothetical protein
MINLLQYADLAEASMQSLHSSASRSPSPEELVVSEIRDTSSKVENASPEVEAAPVHESYPAEDECNRFEYPVPIKKTKEKSNKKSKKKILSRKLVHEEEQGEREEQEEF